MVDRVKKSVAVHISQIGHFKSEYAIRCQQCPHTFSHLLQVISVGKHVVRSEQFRGSALLNNPVGNFQIKKSCPSFNASRSCSFGNGARRVNTQYTQAPALKACQHCPVI